MATATAAPKAPKRALPPNLGKTSNNAARLFAAIDNPAAVKMLGILSTGVATVAELEKIIAPSETLIGDIAAGLIKAKLVGKYNVSDGLGGKGQPGFILTDRGGQVWASAQTLAG